MLSNSNKKERNVTSTSVVKDLEFLLCNSLKTTDTFSRSSGFWDLRLFEFRQSPLMAFNTVYWDWPRLVQSSCSCTCWHWEFQSTVGTRWAVAAGCVINTLIDIVSRTTVTSIDILICGIHQKHCVSIFPPSVYSSMVVCVGENERERDATSVTPPMSVRTQRKLLRG